MKNFSFCYLIAALFFIFHSSNLLAGPPFLTDDPQPVDFKHWEFYVASAMQFDKLQSDATLPHFEVNYGAVPNVQLHIIVPLAYSRTDNNTVYGFSNTELGIKYRFIQETDKVPQIGTFPIVLLPTGDKSKNLGNEKTQVYFPVWLQKSWGKLTAYGGGGYWYNPGTGNRNWIFTGWEAQYDFSETVTLGGEFYYHTADAVDSKAQIGFNLGGYINFNEHNHLLFSIGKTSNTNNTETAYLGYQLTI
jgi:hypothetical protein